MIYFNSPSKAECSLTMDGCRIENCDKVFLNSEKSKINVKNSEFLNNKSTGNGGAFATYSYEYLYFENCTFRGNKASDSGGAICSDYVECKNCTFDKNEASYGGAICAHNLKLYNNTFKNNYSRNDGGAIYSGCGSEKEQIVGNTFENNKAKRYGGAIRIETVGKNFRNNTSTPFEPSSSILSTDDVTSPLKRCDFQKPDFASFRDISQKPAGRESKILYLIQLLCVRGFFCFL